MSEARAEIDVLGQRITVRAPRPPEYLRALAEYLEGKIRAVRTEGRVQEPTRLTVLAGLHVVDELFRAREREAGVAARLDRLLADLERVLGALPPGPLTRGAAQGLNRSDASSLRCS